MSEYRDDVAALLARIQTLEQDLAEARGTAPSGAAATPARRRCPFCERKMVAGKLVTKGRLGHVTDVVDLRFQRAGGDEDDVRRYQSPSPDWFCADCCTVIVKGRFAD
ncbi:MAG: hypothetical protein ACHREM_33405 [Polyangiales bacterium]